MRPLHTAVALLMAAVDRRHLQVVTASDLQPPFLPLPVDYVPQRSASDAMRAYLGAKFSSAAEIIEQGAGSVWKKVGQPRGQSLDECMVLTFYTVDLQSMCSAALEDNFFFILNKALRTQDVPLLSPGTALADLYWYLLRALSKVPREPPGTVVWRGVNVALASLSSSYAVNSIVCYTAFTSTTRDPSVMQDFAVGRGGTLTKVVASEARSIREYSLFQGEDELLLLPNSTFVVDVALDSKQAKAVASFPGASLPDGVDLIVMTQLPTSFPIVGGSEEQSQELCPSPQGGVRVDQNDETRSVAEQQGGRTRAQVQRLTPDSGGVPGVRIRNPDQPFRSSTRGFPNPAQATNTTAPSNFFLDAADRFTVHDDQPIGEGAYGAVFMAFDNDLGSWVAVKETAVTSLSSAKEKVAALRAEFETLQNLSHPNIVKVFDFKLNERLGVAQIYMEWMSSGSVRSIIADSGFRLHENAIRRYLSSALDGLTYLHGRNLLHRDVKPGNMLVSGDGTIKLSDFGTSKLTEGSMTATTTKTVIGTSAFLAPETVRDGKYSRASDMWALACSAVEMGTGFPPWRELPEEKRTLSLSLMFHIGTAQPPNHHPLIPSHLSQTLKDILESWFHFDPKARPSAAAAREHPYFNISAALPTDTESAQQYREARERHLSHEHSSTGGSQVPLNQGQNGQGLAASGTEWVRHHTTSTGTYSWANSGMSSLPPLSTSNGASLTGSLTPA